MIDRDLTGTELDMLESLIDANGLQGVLEAISTICGEKAVHIAESYQDASTAKLWAILEGVVGVASTRAEGL